MKRLFQHHSTFNAKALLLLCALCAWAVAVASAGDAYLLTPHTVQTIHGGYVLGTHTIPAGARVRVITQDSANAQIISQAGDVLMIPLTELRFPAGESALPSLPPQPVAAPLPPTRTTPPPASAPAATPAQNFLKVRIDHSAGRRTVELLRPIKVNAETTLDILGVYPEKPVNPSAVTISLAFARQGPQWRYLDDHPRDLKLLIDGSHLDLSDLDYSGDVMPDSSISELLLATVTPKTLASIGNGKSVEAHLGNTTFVIPFAARAGLRQFADSLTQLASAPPTTP
jgi:hypothetical protein